MTSEARREPQSDNLLAAQKAAFLVVEYQPPEVNSVASMDRQLLINNKVGCSKAAFLWSRCEKVPGFLDLSVQTGETVGVQFSYDQESERGRVPPPTEEATRRHRAAAFFAAARR
jgi:hypothetical protein